MAKGKAPRHRYEEAFKRRIVAKAQPASPVPEIVLPCGSHLRCSAIMDPVLVGHALVALKPGALDSNT